MNDLNSVLLEGNLTRDPLLSTTPNGTTVCNFSVGTNYLRKRNDSQVQEVSFFDVEVWASLGETCAQYLKKGRGVRVVGRLKQERWKSSDGQPRSRTKIVAEHVEFRPLPQRRNDGEQARQEELVESAERQVRTSEIVEELSVI